MDLTYPEECYRTHIETIIDDILGPDKLTFRIENFVLYEKSPDYCARAECDLITSYGALKLRGSGSGIMEALFNAFIAAYRKEYYCLETVEFEDFSARVKFSDGQKRSKIDAPVEITVAIKTHHKTRLYFRAQSSSLTGAAIDVVSAAIEFLINCERAVTALCLDIHTLREAKKGYLIDSYVFKLTELVSAANFEKTVSKVEC